MMIDFSRIWVDVECPNCKYQDYVHLIDAKTEKTIFCHNCKIQIELIDSDASVHSGIDSMTNALKEFENSLKNFKI